MKSVMQHQFSQVPKADIPRSRFNRSHGHKTTFDAGYLVPVLIDEALPGDTINCNMTGFARLATPLHPIMDNIYLDSFFFACPVRLLWENWEKFNGEQTNPGDSTDYLVPELNMTGISHEIGSIGDHFGLPTGVNDLNTNALFFRCYNKMFDDWFRDQNLIDSLEAPTDDGPDDPTHYTLQRRGKRHDYFTSSLPWPQKGDSVDIPLGQFAPIVGLGKATQNFYDTAPADAYETGANASTVYSSYQAIDTTGADSTFYVKEDPSNIGFPDIRANLQEASAATINQLRQAFQLQKLYERDARGGTRYTEVIKAHFGVTSPDARMQRVEYLGGGSSPVVINPIAQTSSTDTTSPQANLAAIGVAQLNNHGFQKSFTEHCIIIGVVSARADLTYQQGIDRMHSRQTRWDFYWPALSHIGEQAVLNKEIYADGSLDDELVFGYQERYGEYRYKQSKITGHFRSASPLTLDTWHLSQDYESRPLLNEEFIQENPPIDRVIATVDEPHFLFDSYFDYKCARPMPVYGVPGLIDHF